MKTQLIYLLILFPLLTFGSLLKQEGKNLLEMQHNISLEQNLENKKGVVVLFLSSTCPCSNSHIDLIKKLFSEYTEFNFIGVHSNQNEKLEDAQKYFSQKNIPFPIIEDTKAKIADEFKALKTPHVYVLSKTGEILYQGGVTDSAMIETSERIFLREALTDIQQNKKVRTPMGRTLGCMISREDY